MNLIKDNGFALTLCVVFASFITLMINVDSLASRSFELARVNVSQTETQLSASAAALEKLYFVQDKLEVRGLDGPAEVIGELLVMISEDFESEPIIDVYIKDADNGRLLEVKTPKGTVPPGLETGMVARVKGNVSSNIITTDLNGDGSAIEVLSAPVIEPINETRSVLVIPTHLSDRNLECTVGQMENIMFNNWDSIAKAFAEVSNGALTFSGDILPITKIPYSYTGSFPVGMSELLSYAQSLGYDPSAYDHLMFVYPAFGGTTIAGQGSVGGKYTYIYRCAKPLTYQHELGHNLRMLHASEGTCEYCDHSDFMGNYFPNTHDLNAPHKEQLGWLPQSTILDASSGTFTLAPLDFPMTDPSQPRVLKHYRPATNDYLYISYRDDEGVSAGRVPTKYNNKVNIHTWNGVYSRNTNFSRGLLPGETFSSATDGITVTFVERTTAGAVVRVTTNCVAPAPTVQVSPQQHQLAVATEVVYQVSVTNPVASGCGDATFSLGVTAPTGWTIQNPFGSQTIGYGQTVTTNVTVAAAAGTADGSYPIVFTATNQTAGKSGSTEGSYVIDSSGPDAPTNVTLSSKKSFNQLSWTAPSGVVARYNVYRNGTKIGDTTNTSFNDRFLTSGELVYTVTSVGLNGVESAPSDPAITGGTDSGSGGTDTSSGKPDKCEPWPSCRNN